MIYRDAFFTQPPFQQSEAVDILDILGIRLLGVRAAHGNESRGPLSWPPLCEKEQLA